MLVLVLLGVKVPGVVLEPIQSLADMAIPAMLLAFGMSLVGSRPLERAGGRRADVLLAALATAAAGPIGFVALVSPQIARRLLVERQPGLAASAAIGALLVSSADLAARLVFVPTELPVGILTLAIGGVYLGALLVSEWKKAT